MGGSGASITAYLKDDKSRETDEILKEWKRELQKWPDCAISLEKQSSLGSTMTMNPADQVNYILVSTQYDELEGGIGRHCGRAPGQTGGDPCPFIPGK